MNLLPTTIPVLLVINKVDNMEHKNELLPFIQDIAKERHFAAIVPVSAKQNNQLDTLLDAIRPYLPEGEKSTPKMKSPTATSVFLPPRSCAKKYSASPVRSCLIPSA